MYAVANDGQRVCCPHPLELTTLWEVTGLMRAEAETAGRIGYVSFCMCFGCGQQMELDLGRDAAWCTKCGSFEVRCSREAVGMVCPHCQEGKFVEHDTGAYC